MATVFNGKEFVVSKFEAVQRDVARFQARAQRAPTILSIFPYEDDASVLYTKLKRRDAQSVGIKYATQPISLKEDAKVWMQAVQESNANPKVDGLIVQKPARSQFMQVTGKSKDQYFSWWSAISESLFLEKDVDGLSPHTLLELARVADQVQRGKQKAYSNLDTFVLPATAQAVIDVALEAVGNSVEELRKKKVVLLGTSVIVGRPAVYGFWMLGVKAEIYGSEADLVQVLPSADIIVSATGRADLISAEWIQQGSILLDVGAPKPEFQATCYGKASFYTPVPGGIGPVTRACLLENLLKVLPFTTSPLEG